MHQLTGTKKFKLLKTDENGEKVYLPYYPEDESVLEPMIEEEEKEFDNIETIKSASIVVEPFEEISVHLPTPREPTPREPTPRVPTPEPSPRITTPALPTPSEETPPMSSRVETPSLKHVTEASEAEKKALPNRMMLDQDSDESINLSNHDDDDSEEEAVKEAEIVQAKLKAAATMRPNDMYGLDSEEDQED
jgi:hypothetical protein